MAIVKSAVKSSVPQADGSISVIAEYEDHEGTKYTRTWRVPPQTDVSAFVNAEGFALQANLIESEELELENEAMSGRVPDTGKVKHAVKANVDGRIIRRLLSQPIELGWLDSVEYLDGLTAAQIQAATGLSGKALSDARAAIKTLVNARNMLRTYVPPLTGQ